MKWCPSTDSNREPTASKAVASTNWARGAAVSLNVGVERRLVLGSEPRDLNGTSSAVAGVLPDYTKPRAVSLSKLQNLWQRRSDSNRLRPNFKGSYVSRHISPHRLSWGEAGNRTLADSFTVCRAATTLAKPLKDYGCCRWSGRLDSNQRHPASKTGTLPTELRPEVVGRGSVSDAVIMDSLSFGSGGGN